MKHIRQTLVLLDKDLHNVFNDYIINCVTTALIAQRLNGDEGYLARAVDTNVLLGKEQFMENTIDWVKNEYPQYVAFFIESGCYWSEETRNLGRCIWAYLE